MFARILGWLTKVLVKTPAKIALGLVVALISFLSISSQDASKLPFTDP